ncbi:MAG: hypothetical protein J6T52_06960 [Bacteroidaceae bacterium]|jgi:hypothetical protein|nr:hypothetical protein [Bacteroidaceae bacterium]
MKQHRQDRNSGTEVHFPLARDQGCRSEHHHKFDDLAYTKFGMLQRWRKSIRLSVNVPLTEPNVRRVMIREIYDLLQHLEDE